MRGAGRTRSMLDVLPTHCAAAAREVRRQRLLALLEDVDRECPMLANCGERLARSVQADQHERRHKRQRADSAGSGADRYAVSPAGGDDGHAGGEVTERVSYEIRGDLTAIEKRCAHVYSCPWFGG